MHTTVTWTLALLFPAVTVVHAQVPQLINYHGRVEVNGVGFDGPGQFKFALVDAGATGASTSYWSNDGTSTAGSEPAAAVVLTVTAGQYSVLLGDTALPNMTAIPAGVFDYGEVFVRIWFNDGTNGSQVLTPDHELAPPAPVNARGVRGGSPAPTTDCWQLRAGAPAARVDHAAVWTGSEMIVWGGGVDDTLRFNDGGRYHPASNSWTAVSAVGAPAARAGHTAVWTGSEMIVWGGAGSNPAHRNDGGRYHPAANSWTAMTTTGAPAGRDSHTALWTGSEMIVWGGGMGGSFDFADGGRYHPAGDSWTAVSTSGAPAARHGHTAVWTGSEMIVWGGTSFGNDFNTGGRYRPADNTWRTTTTTGAPTPRREHTAVWTGSEMIVWGGTRFGSIGTSDGSRYYPAGNSWTALSSSGAPVGRHGHTAVWTGSEMIVWGGFRITAGIDGVNSGGRYRPADNSWRTTTTTGAPAARHGNTAVWTGSMMIVWGGQPDSASRFSTGGRYHPAVDGWTTMNSDASEPLTARSQHTAVWTGSEMIVWGGEDGSVYPGIVIPHARAARARGNRYDPTGHHWTEMSIIGAPPARHGHSAVWTGSEMIVWGGYNPGEGAFTLNDGGRYQPAANSWTPVSTTGAPRGRAEHTAVWTGTEMIVWGGSSEDALNDGGRYHPAGNSWASVSTSGAPTARWGHTALWTGNEMIVWGGTPDFSGGLNDGARYDPAGNTWTAVSTSGAPSPRRSHTAVWTGNEMIVWGGGVFPNASNDGGRYEPEQNVWTPMSTAGVPDARFFHTAVWAGGEMIVWGGTPDLVNGLNSGGRYRPADNRWRPTATTGAPAPRRDHTAVWTGREMIVWGGRDSTRYFSDTFSYTPDCDKFDITSVVLEGGALKLTFPTVPGLTYTLWRSDALTDGTWTNTGLPALAGTGAILTFIVYDTGMARRFFRVQADPTPDQP